MLRACALASILALSACGGGLGSAEVVGQPTATDENVVLSVVSIEPGDVTVVELVVVNGDDDAYVLSRNLSPITLVDASGQEIEGPDEAIEVPAYSSDRLRVEFAGRPGGDRMSLQARDLSVPDLPTSATRFAAGPLPTVGDLSRAQANHASGSTLRLTSVTFGDDVTEVGIEVVNGADNEVDLSGSSDRARLADETGREYPLLPPQANPGLDIPEGQSLRGTLRFAGRVPASVQRLTFQTNPEYGGDEDYSRDLRFALEIPLTSSDAP